MIDGPLIVYLYIHGAYTIVLQKWHEHSVHVAVLSIAITTMGPGRLHHTYIRPDGGSAGAKIAQSLLLLSKFFHDMGNDKLTRVHQYDMHSCLRDRDSVIAVPSAVAVAVACASASCLDEETNSTILAWT